MVGDQEISHAISMFQTDANGDCPKSIEDLVSGKYLPKAPTDPWGQPFMFKCPGDKNTDVADIWSKGRDKQEGTDDDVKGWDKLGDACKAK